MYGPDEDDEFDGPVIYPAPFSRWVFVRAGLDFVGHVLEGAHCALGIVAANVVAAEVFASEKKNFEESVRCELEMLPEVED